MNIHTAVTLSKRGDTSEVTPKCINDYVTLAYSMDSDDSTIGKKLKWPQKVLF